MNERLNSGRKNEIIYIIEAAVEYFITLMVTESYLAKVTSAIGMDDALIAVLTAFTSLGTAFQLFAVFLAHKRPVKRWVTPLHIVNQTFFALIYFIPVVSISYTARVAFFILFLLGANLLNGVVQPPKFHWYMSFVEDGRRGSFTATKEIVSLISGMIFTYAMGAVIDAREAAGDLRGAFLIIGITIFCLMLLHTATLLLSDAETAPAASRSLREELGTIVKDKSLFRVIAVSFFWSIANYATTPFYGTYKIKELGFSMTFVAILAAVQSIVRAIASRPIGAFADKHGFSRMLTVVFSIEAAALLTASFAVPANGRYVFAAYVVLHGIAMGGINSGETNLIYDYVAEEHRTTALALKSGIAGITGFLTTLLVTIPVNYIQKNGNTLFGIPVYAQQVTSIFGFVAVVGILCYLVFVVRRMARGSACER